MAKEFQSSSFRHMCHKQTQTQTNTLKQLVSVAHILVSMVLVSVHLFECHKIYQGSVWVKNLSLSWLCMSISRAAENQIGLCVHRSVKAGGQMCTFHFVHQYVAAIHSPFCCCWPFRTMPISLNRIGLIVHRKWWMSELNLHNQSRILNFRL